MFRLPTPASWTDSTSPHWFAACRSPAQSRGNTPTHWIKVVAEKPSKNKNKIKKYTYIHYSTVHYSTLLYITVQYITVHCYTLQYSTVHCITVTLQYIAAQYSTVKYITLNYSTLHYSTLHYITVQYITVHYGTVHCSTLHYITVQYITVHYGTVHCSTVHAYVYIYICSRPPNHANLQGVVWIPRFLQGFPRACACRKRLKRWLADISASSWMWQGGYPTWSTEVTMERSSILNG